MFCIKCGKKIEDSQQFCIYCGAKQPGSFDVQKTEEEKKINHETGDQGSDFFHKPESIQGPESSQGSQSSLGSESSQGSQSSRESESSQVQQSSLGSESPKSEQSSQGSESFQVPGASQESDSSQGQGSLQQPNSFQQPESFQQSAPYQQTNSYQQPAPYQQTDPYQQSDPYDQTEFSYDNPEPAQAQLLDTPNGGSKKRSRLGAVVAVLVSVLILVLILVGGLVWWNQPAKRVERLIQAGQKYLAEADYDQSILSFQKAIEIDPKNAELYSDLAGAYIQKAQNASDDEKVKLYKLASNSYKEALYYDEDNTQLVADISDLYVEWSDFYIDQQDYDAAIDLIEKGLKIVDEQVLEDRLNELTTDSYDSSAPADSKTTDSKPTTNNQSTTSNHTITNNQPKSPVSLFVRQVENTSFPQIHFYASVLNGNNESVDNLKREDFKIQELQADGSIQDVQIDEVYQVIDSKTAYIDLVIDRSSSMSDSMMRQAKNAATALIQNMKDGNQVEVISFDSYVYQDYPFSSDLSSAIFSIDAIQPYGNTALMDALYTAVYNTYKVGEGAKCVIAFTDGEENSSNYTVNDVVNISQSTGIPVYLIGIGSGVDEYSLRDIAQKCSGEYYSASDVNLEQELSDIYNNIYKDQQNNYIFKYTSKNASDTTGARQIVVNMSDNSGYTGSCQKEFVPVAQTAIDANFGFDVDNIIPDSSYRALTNADLEGLSLAKLRIARNEIFARHGRLFKDNLLNQWFYSKGWYLQIQPKYSPSEFDRLSPYPISTLENNNIDLIIAREEYIMNYENIFPNAGNIPLSTYDVALTKAVLQKALTQVASYPQTSVRDQNIAFIQNAIANATM